MRIASALVTTAILVGTALLGCGCSDDVAEGETRPLRKEGRAGIVVAEGTERFHDGEWRKHGDFVFRDDHGEVISRGAYVDGLETGPWEQVYEDGGKGQGPFTAGQRTGLWTTFHRGGGQQDKGHYEDGRRTGSWTSFRADGSLLRVADYVAGKLDGRVVWYGPDGTTIDGEGSGLYTKGQRIRPLSRASR